jgi:secreted trypsin-like serine protease
MIYRAYFYIKDGYMKKIIQSLFISIIGFLFSVIFITHSNAADLDSLPEKTAGFNWYQQIDGSYRFGQSQQTRIVGGIEATSGDYPWMTALLYADGSWYGCGASLIASKWLLTAAHCTADLDTSNPDIDVVIGRHSISNDGQGQTIKIVKIYNHPDYSYSTDDSDIALLELEQAATATPLTIINPFQITNSLIGISARVIGWGNMSTTGENYPENLRQLDVPIISNTICNSSQSYDGSITENMLCAGIPEGGIDACQGDSGGPLVISENGNYKQVGIVSWGEGCAVANFYGVYTRLSQFYSWVNTTTGGSITNTSKPTTPSEVDLTPVETDTNHISYFLLAISNQLTIDASVDYITKDNTAIAGQDYIATSGTATIKAGETSTAIGVEIIGDSNIESSESFYLTISNPQGASFPKGITSLSATKTIIDDD